MFTLLTFPYWKRMTLNELQDLPTINHGIGANLKIDNGRTRVWISRMTKEDGMDYDNQILVEHYIDGEWIDGDRYDPTRSPP